MTTKTKAKSSKASKATPAKRPTSSVQIVRETLARNPQATPEMIAAALKKAGMDKTPGFISTIKADFMGCYRALEAAGALK